MKRNLLGLFAVVLAIAVSSFTVRKTTDVYLVYKATATVQKDVTSYDAVLTSPGTITNGFPIKLAWFKIAGDDNGIITSTEFENGFEALDQTATGSNLLTDETENHSTIEFK